jgi:hypothetical protein
MMGGVMAGGGFYMGHDPLPTNFRPDTNPKGIFEDRETIAINEALLAPFYPRPARTAFGRRRQRGVLERGVRWAAVLEPEAEPTATPELDARIRAQVSSRPFCFKDPRFSYTLPAWRNAVGDAVFVCVFREPARTANSLVTEWARHPERRSSMTYENGLAHWHEVYRRILRRHSTDGDWVFVHYDQALDGSAIPPLEEVLGTRLDRSFPAKELKRTPPTGRVSPEVDQLYTELCERAAFPARTGVLVRG